MLSIENSIGNLSVIASLSLIAYCETGVTSIANLTQICGSKQI